MKSKGLHKFENVEKDVQSVGELIAKKDFVIQHNDYTKKIKAGDDISDVPATYHENLKTEKVI